MERTVRSVLSQAKLCESSNAPIERIKQAMIDKHVALLAEAAGGARAGGLFTHGLIAANNEARDLFSETEPSMLSRSTTEHQDSRPEIGCSDESQQLRPTIMGVAGGNAPGLRGSHFSSEV